MNGTAHKKEKQILINTAYTMGGALLMNGVLQLLIYPLFNRILGSDTLGNLLYIMGLVAILCPSVGQALNTSRLVARREYPVTNGDYNCLLLLFGGAGSAAALLLARESLTSPAMAVLAAILFLSTCFRYYGDVEYRLNLNYKRYFIYYGVLTLGYVLGFLLYFLWKSWYLVFLTGELLALLYLALTGTVFRNFFARSRYFAIVFRRGGFLTVSYLITNFTLNIDRLVLKHLIGDLAVTQYYVTSLIGKTMVLLVAPVNTILISYLTRKKEKMNRQQFLGFVGMGVGVSLVFFLFAQIATPVFIRLLYGELYEGVRELITVVNLSQILGLLSAYLFIIVLTFTEEKWQMILQVIHLCILTVLVLAVTGNYGIGGFAMAVLAANVLRVLAVIGLGLVRLYQVRESIVGS